MSNFVTEVLNFAAANIFSFESSIYHWQSQRFLFQTHSLKTRVKPVLFPGLTFLITYTSGSNWYALISVSPVTVSFANSPFATVDTAVVSSSHPVVFCKESHFQ